MVERGRERGREGGRKRERRGKWRDRTDVEIARHCLILCSVVR